VFFGRPLFLLLNSYIFVFADKICDQVSDAVLDSLLRVDPYARVSCQCAAKTGMIFVCGDIASKASIDIQKVVRSTIKSIGYDGSTKGIVM